MQAVGDDGNIGLAGRIRDATVRVEDGSAAGLRGGDVEGGSRVDLTSGRSNGRVFFGGISSCFVIYLLSCVFDVAVNCYMDFFRLVVWDSV